MCPRAPSSLTRGNRVREHVRSVAMSYTSAVQRRPSSRALRNVSGDRLTRSLAV